MTRREYTYVELMELPAYVGAARAAEICGCSRSAITQAARAGRVRGRKIGGSWRFVTAELLEDLGLSHVLSALAAEDARRGRRVALLAAMGSHIGELGEEQ